MCAMCGDIHCPGCCVVCGSYYCDGKGHTTEEIFEAIGEDVKMSPEPKEDDFDNPDLDDLADREADRFFRELEREAQQ